MRTTPLFAGLVGGAQGSALYVLLTEIQETPIPTGLHIWLLMVLCGAFSAPFLGQALGAFDFKTRRLRAASPIQTWHGETMRWYEAGARWNEAAARWHEEAEGWGEVEPDSPTRSAQYRRHAEQWRKAAAQWECNSAQWCANHQIDRQMRGRRERRWALFMGFVGAIFIAPLFMMMFVGLTPHPPIVDWVLFVLEYSLLWLVVARCARYEARHE